mgnify:CR=1 FL=1
MVETSGEQCSSAHINASCRRCRLPASGPLQGVLRVALRPRSCEQASGFLPLFRCCSHIHIIMSMVLIDSCCSHIHIIMSIRFQASLFDCGVTCELECVCVYLLGYVCSVCLCVCVSVCLCVCVCQEFAFHRPEDPAESAVGGRFVELHAGRAPDSRRPRGRRRARTPLERLGQRQRGRRAWRPAWRRARRPAWRPARRPAISSPACGRAWRSSMHRCSNMLERSSSPL